MDQRISCTSPLPRIWAIETLACSSQVDISLLLELLEKTPEICTDIGRNARELVSLKLLESLRIQGARVNPDFSQTIKLDLSDRCEDVLRRILTQTSPTHIRSAGTEISKWDLEPFIEHKRSNLPKNALKQLKDAIHTGSPSISASLKELSGLAVGNHAEHEAPEKDSNCDGITPRVEGSDRNDSFIWPRDSHDDNLVRVIRKRSATSESAAGKLCATHLNSVKKYKHENSSTEQYLGRKLISSGADRQIADMSIISVPQIEGTSYGCERRSEVGSMELNEPSKDDDNGCTSSKGLVGPDEVLPHGEWAAHCDIDRNIEDAKGVKNGFSDLKGTNEDGDNSEQNIENVGEVEESNKKSEEQGQGQNIEEANGYKNGCSDLKKTNGDGDNSEQNIQNVNEVEEHAHLSNDYDGNDDEMCDVARKENASFGPSCTHSQDSLKATNSRDPNLLAGTPKLSSGEERCSIKKKTRVKVKRRNGPSGDGNNQCTGLVTNDEVVPHEKQAPHCGDEVLNENFDKAIPHSKGENVENGRKGFNKDANKFEQDVQRMVPTIGEAEEDVNKSTDNDEYHEERTNIDTKKKLFLSSQCTYSQDSLATTDWRELQLCMKCNNGGKLLSCASDSCPLVIHESCLGSDASFDTRGKFYCPFCAYSQAISKYTEVKKKATLARKDLANFICFGSRKELKKHSLRSFRVEGNHLQQNDVLSKRNELNQKDGVEKVRNRRPMKNQGETKSSQVSETSGSEKQADVRSKKGVLYSPEMDLPCKRKCSRSSESSDAEELSEEDNESPGASKYFVRVRKQERKNFCRAVPQFRRKRLPWTSIEEEKLQEGVRLFSNPDDKVIQWKRILEYGSCVFQSNRSTPDLRDKWRNMCKASPKSK